MRAALAVCAIASAVVACDELPPPQGPVEARPVKSACPARSRSPASVGLDVRLGRRHSTAQTLFVTNAGAEPRSVRVRQVSRVEGPCSGEWATQSAIDFADAETAEVPGETSVAPAGSLEIRIGDQRARGAWACTKLAVAVWLDVDGEAVCADAGSWIAERD